MPVHMRRNFSINVRAQSAEQVLEEICAYTGLGYLIEPDGVLLYMPTGGAAGRDPAGNTRPVGLAPTASVSLSDPYVAKMVIPLGDGKTMEWLIRRSELPEDLRRMRERDLAEGFEAARRLRGKDQP